MPTFDRDPVSRASREAEPTSPPSCGSHVREWVSAEKLPSSETVSDLSGMMPAQSRSRPHQLGSGSSLALRVRPIQNQSHRRHQLVVRSARRATRTTW